MSYLKDIYFLNVYGLAAELRNGTLTEVCAIKHFVVVLIIGGVGFGVPITLETIQIYSSAIQIYSDLFTLVTASIVTYIGTWSAYNANRDGQDFFIRFAVLSLPIGLKLSLIFLILGSILFYLVVLGTGQLGSNIGNLAHLLNNGLSLLFVVFFFRSMRKAIESVSGIAEEKNV